MKGKCITAGFYYKVLAQIAPSAFFYEFLCFLEANHLFVSEKQILLQEDSTRYLVNKFLPHADALVATTNFLVVLSAQA